MTPGIEALAARLRSQELTVTRLVDGSGVILDVNGLKVYSLNETGMFLLERIQQGTVTSGDLVRALAEHFEVEPETAAADLQSFLDELLGRLG